MDIVQMGGQNTELDANIAAMSTAQLRDELARNLQLNAEQLLHLAAIWRELERRGEDLSALRTGMGAYLPMIASGQLDASAVVKFAGQDTLLRSLCGLPMRQQREIVQGKELRVLEFDQDGGVQVRELPAYALTATQVRQVFTVGRLRDKHEQEALLAQGISRKRKTPTRKVRLDAEADQLVIGRTRIAVNDVLEALATEVGTEGSEGIADKSLVIKVTEEQHRNIRTRAATTGTSITALLRVAMQRAGLL